MTQPCNVTAPQHWHLSSTGRGGIRSKSSSSDISSSLWIKTNHFSKMNRPTTKKITHCGFLGLITSHFACFFTHNMAKDHYELKKGGSSTDQWSNCLWKKDAKRCLEIEPCCCQLGNKSGNKIFSLAEAKQWLHPRCNMHTSLKSKTYLFDH